MGKFRVVVVDAGHGGQDAGAVDGRDDDPIVTFEKKVNLDISARIASGLRAKGVRVIETRVGDKFLPLFERVKIANLAKADIFVSVHCNSSVNPSAQGIETFVHLNASPKAVKLAESVHSVLLSVAGAVDRGVRRADFQVLRGTIMPAILIEFGFLSNPGEEGKLNNPGFRQKLAAAVVDGVLRYFVEN